jgi:hypothetical protein
LLQIADLMLARANYALDRARLRQANRLFESSRGPVDATMLSTIEASDILASRVFGIGELNEKPA